MKTYYMTGAAAVVAVIAVLAIGGMSPALAQGKSGASTPNNFSYELKNGRRVPKGARTANADGSWKEEVRDGACVTIKERTASGEYREVRKCD